jgi:MSHA biogenesis protein MshN
MSLVNQMLQDLEQRRAQLPRGDSLRGLHAAPPATTPHSTLWPTLLISAALGGVAYGWWLTFAEPGLQPGFDAPPLAAHDSKPVAPGPAHTWVVATSEVSDAPGQSAPEVDAEWDKTWEPRTAQAVSVAALEETVPEDFVQLAAETPSTTTPTPSTIEPPAPKPVPPTTQTVVAQAASISTRGPSSMHKTLREPSPTEHAAQRYADALTALRSGDTLRAETQLRAALDQVPAHTQAAETLVALLLQQGRAQDAEAILATAVAAAPHAPQLLILHARVLAEAGRDREAVTLLQSPTLSNDADSQALLGALQQRLGNDTQAADAYRQALSRAPQRGAWWLGLAISLERSQQPVAALEAYRRALADATLDTQVTGYVRGRIVALDNSQG